MKRPLLTSVVPAYLLLCLLAGGSRQGVWANAALQLLAVFLLAWAAAVPRAEPPTAASRQLVALTIAAAVLVLFQLIPLPPDVWSGLPGRDLVEAGFGLLGYERNWMPLSLAPYETLDSAYTLLPPLAVAAAIITLRAYRESWIAVVIVAGALASVLLGAVQIASRGTASWSYFYEVRNTGAVGLFANRNHMASLLLAAIPFAGALFATAHPQVKNRGKAFAMLSLGGGGFLLLIAGLVLNESLAAIALAVPVIAATGLILPIGWRMRWLIAPLAGIALAIAILVLGSTTIGSELATEAADLGSPSSRTTIWEMTVRIIGDTFPFGTGFGTFPEVYALQENPAAVGPSFVNHAHNDYLELVLEAGLPGLVLMILFLAWWAFQTVRVWRSPFSTQFAKAATIATAAVLAHSIVDYPLRTAAIAALFAACVAIMAQGRAQPRPEGPKHVRIG